MYRKIVVPVLASGLVLSVVSACLAQYSPPLATPPSISDQSPSPSPTQNDSPTVNEQNLSFLLKLFAKLQAFEKKNGAHVRRGGITVTEVTKNTITGTKNGVSITIHVGSAVIVRKFWGVASLPQVSVGDQIRVIGTWSDASHTAINAFIVRDMFIQEKNDTFTGKVTTTTPSSFSLHSLKRGDWTVQIGASTKITGKKDAPMQLSSIAVGDKITVDGLIDWANRTITADTILDTSYPPKAAK